MEPQWKPKIKHALPEESTCIPHQTTQQLYNLITKRERDSTCSTKRTKRTPCCSPPRQGSARASSLRRRAANGGSQNSADRTAAAPSRTAAAQRHHRRRPRPSSPGATSPPPPPPRPPPPAESGGSPAAFPIARQIRSPRHPRRGHSHCRPGPTRGLGFAPALLWLRARPSNGERKKGWGGMDASEREKRQPRRRRALTAEAQRQRVSARVLPRVKSGSGSRSYRPCGKRYQ